MTRIKFLRQDANRHSRLGRNRKKMQKWRRPKGRDSKMRQKRKSYPASARIGYKSSRKDSGKVLGLVPVLVQNINDLDKIKKEEGIIISRVGARKKLAIISEAQKRKIKIINLGGKNEPK